jgi:hypothetical protein
MDRRTPLRVSARSMVFTPTVLIGGPSIGGRYDRGTVVPCLFAFLKLAEELLDVVAGDGRKRDARAACQTGPVRGPIVGGPTGRLASYAIRRFTQ